MNIWQIRAAEELREFINSYLEIERISFAGSVLDPNMLDVFSDVDADIYLPDDTVLDMKELIKKITEQFGTVFGYEIYSYDYKDMLRICFENGWRFDLSFHFPCLKESRLMDYTFADKIDSTVNQFWFIAFMVLVKIGRNDFLIAAHLALELCQISIVIQMLIRDNKKNTNIHRFGGKEDVPILHLLTRSSIHRDVSENDRVNEILYILYQAAEQMDEVSAALDSEYVKRQDKLRTLQYQFCISCRN